MPPTDPWTEADALVPLPEGRTVKIHTHRAPGPSPAVVLLHGLLSSGRQWRGTLARLAPAGRNALLAPDLPGFGLSGLVRRPQRLPDYADALESWAGAGRLGRVAVVGHSFGGLVALDWAARYPERVSALGLVDPAVVPHGFKVPASFAHPVLGRALLLLVSLPPIAGWFFRYVVDDAAAIPSADRGGYGWSMRRCRALLGLREFYATADLPATLRAVRCPIKLGWGLHDRILPLSDAERIEAAAPGIASVRWPCGHSVMAERPADSDRFVLDVAAAAAL